MNNPFFVQVGLGNFPEYAYIVQPNYLEQFCSIPLLGNVEYHCLLIDAQALAFSDSFNHVINADDLKPYLDRIHFGCFAVAPVNALYDLSFRKTDRMAAEARLVTGKHKHFEHSYKVAGVPIDMVFDEILDNAGFIDGLVMDIKGVEVDVLKSLTYHPRVVVVQPYSLSNKKHVLRWAIDNNYDLIGEMRGPHSDNYPGSLDLIPDNLLLLKQS